MSNSTDLSLETILERLRHDPLRISVFGEFSAGKSTFINALIGEDLLSVAVEPTTAVPTYVVYAREFDVSVKLKSGEVLTLFGKEKPFWTRFVGRESVLHTLQRQKDDIKRFLTQWTKEGEKADQVEHISMEIPLPWLQQGLELVDTPGTNNEFTRHHNYTENVARETDIAIILMDSRQGGGKRTEFDFINAVQKSVGKTIIVLNKIDAMEPVEREDVVEYFQKDALPKHWEGAMLPAVYGLSALSRLDNDLAGREPGLVKEFGGFLSKLEALAKQERGPLLLHRMGNPEKILFNQAMQAEAQKRPQDAHKIYFDLLDVLAAAGLEQEPAVQGIKRCETHLKIMVRGLDEINRDISHAFSLSEKEPDAAIKLFRQIIDRQIELGQKDMEIATAVDRLSAHILKRDMARKVVQNVLETVRRSIKNGKYCQALIKIKPLEAPPALAEMESAGNEEIKELKRTIIEGRERQLSEYTDNIAGAIEVESIEPQKARKLFNKYYNQSVSQGHSEEELRKIEIFVREQIAKGVRQHIKSQSAGHTKYRAWVVFAFFLILAVVFAGGWFVVEKGLFSGLAREEYLIVAMIGPDEASAGLSAVAPKGSKGIKLPMRDNEMYEVIFRFDSTKQNRNVSLPLRYNKMDGLVLNYTCDGEIVFLNESMIVGIQIGMKSNVANIKELFMHAKMENLQTIVMDSVSKSKADSLVGLFQLLASKKLKLRLAMVGRNSDNTIQSLIEALRPIELIVDDVTIKVPSRYAVAAALLKDSSYSEDDFFNSIALQRQYLNGMDFVKANPLWLVARNKFFDLLDTQRPDLSAITLVGFDSTEDFDVSRLKQFAGLASLSICKETPLRLDGLADFRSLRILNLGYCRKLIGAMPRLMLDEVRLPKGVSNKALARYCDSLPGLQIIHLDSGITDYSVLNRLKHLKVLDAREVKSYSSITDLKDLQLLMLPSAVFSDSLRNVLAMLEKELPNCQIVCGVCMGSGWLVLIIPMVLIACLLMRITKRRQNG